jgi:hypothetical protein
MIEKQPMDENDPQELLPTPNHSDKRESGMNLNLGRMFLLL